MTTSEKSGKTVYEEIKGTTSEIISQIRQLFREGNARRLVVKSKEGNILFQSQLTIGVAGTAFAAAIAPVISAILMFLLFVNDAKVIVEKSTGEDDVRDENEIDADVIEIKDEDEDEEDVKGGNSKDNSDGPDK